MSRAGPPAATEREKSASLTATDWAIYTPSMPSTTFPQAVEQLRARNQSAAATYRDWARRLPPGPVSRLALSLAEQRADLGKTLTEISGEFSLRACRVDLEDSASGANLPAAGAADLSDSATVLKMAVAAEDADHEFLAALAGAAVAASAEAADRLASEADAARKRSTWAKDQLELLDMLKN